VGTSAALLVARIGISHSYLEAQYLTNVLADWALGVLWLAVIAAPEHGWAARAHLHLPQPPERLPRTDIVVAASVLTLVSVGHLAVSYTDIPPPPPETAQTTPVITPAEVAMTIELRLPQVQWG
jgi:hypothetical protein